MPLENTIAIAELLEEHGVHPTRANAILTQHNTDRTRTDSSVTAINHLSSALQAFALGEMNRHLGAHDEEAEQFSFHPKRVEFNIGARTVRRMTTFCMTSKSPEADIGGLYHTHAHDCSIGKSFSKNRRAITKLPLHRSTFSITLPNGS
jgi:hypothetical protein